MNDKKNEIEPAINADVKLMFAQVLGQILKERGLTQKEISVLAGVSPSTINDWLSSVPPSNLVAIKKLSRALGLSLSYLLFAEPDERPNSMDEIFEKKEILDGVYEISLKKLVIRGK